MFVLLAPLSNAWPHEAASPTLEANLPSILTLDEASATVGLLCGESPCPVTVSPILTGCKDSIVVFVADATAGPPATDIPLSAAFDIVILFIIINTNMKLEWTHNQAEGFIYCEIDNIIYKSYNGGDNILKIIDGNEVANMGKYDKNDPWEIEKQWISETYSDRFGVYEPLSASLQEMEQWHIDHPTYTEAFPAYGLFEGRYLDRLQRESHMQIGKDMTCVLYRPEEKLYIEWDKHGTGKFYRREWCEENNSFYNVQPCCVFPDNPGRTELSDEEKTSIIEQNGLDLSLI